MSERKLMATLPPLQIQAWLGDERPLPRVALGPNGWANLSKAPKLRLFGQNYEGIISRPLADPKRAFYQYWQGVNQ